MSLEWDLASPIANERIFQSLSIKPGPSGTFCQANSCLSNVLDGLIHQVSIFLITLPKTDPLHAMAGHVRPVTLQSPAVKSEVFGNWWSWFGHLRTDLDPLRRLSFRWSTLVLYTAESVEPRIHQGNSSVWTITLLTRGSHLSTLTEFNHLIDSLSFVGGMGSDDFPYGREV